MENISGHENDSDGQTAEKQRENEIMISER